MRFYVLILVFFISSFGCYVNEVGQMWLWFWFLPFIWLFRTCITLYRYVVVANFLETSSWLPSACGIPRYWHYPEHLHYWLQVVQPIQFWSPCLSSIPLDHVFPVWMTFQSSCCISWWAGSVSWCLFQHVVDIMIEAVTDCCLLEQVSVATLQWPEWGSSGLCTAGMGKRLMLHLMLTCAAGFEWFLLYIPIEFLKKSQSVQLILHM